MPERYTLGHHESVLRSHRWRTGANSAAYLLPHLRPGMRVLDVGSGPGTITVDLARAVYPGHVIGIDASADVVAEATRLATGQGVTNVEFRVADAYDPGFDDGAFDVVHAHQVLQHLGRPVEALASWRALVSPDGLVAARDCDYVGAIVAPARPGLELWASTYQALARHNHGTPDAGRHLKAWAREAGFSVVESSASLWCFEDDSDRAWWGGLWADRTVDSEFAVGVTRRGVGDAATLAAIREGWLAWRDDPDGWMILLHGEILARA
ncbi:methyltransferase domain-containing protein [Protaetiibacter intestinalis]|uniref:Methyltransferase domain-containing protein n=1 Tax=Protaetiibacter intestinalis TaxID=2419774 RepID=A0A387B943_9MICO|nr:methyltransferase domain-containing protein [Protaetiibacter intestinalis]AYF98361.1 methyltransferase domain-containing protein [Protaetiibacter intestinalis]